jgi:hypothetical protein
MPWQAKPPNFWKNSRSKDGRHQRAINEFVFVAVQIGAVLKNAECDTVMRKRAFSRGFSASNCLFEVSSKALAFADALRRGFPLLPLHDFPESCISVQ